MHDRAIAWVGGEHQFVLNLGELRALQKNCDAGPEEIFNRMRVGTWRVDDLVETIRLGLIGSGEMEAKEAGPFVTSLFAKHPMVEFKLTALEILARAILPIGEEDDPVGKAEGEQPPKSGVSAESTETAQ